MGILLRLLRETAGQWINKKYSFISIFVATHNESLVIERLLKSFAALSYPIDRFEIIIVDDSIDEPMKKYRLGYLIY